MVVALLFAMLCCLLDYFSLKCYENRKYIINEGYTYHEFIIVIEDKIQKVKYGKFPTRSCK